RPPLGPAGGGCHGGSGARVEPGGARARTGRARERRAAVAARGVCRGVRYGRRRAAGKARARSRPRRRASGPARGVALRAHRPLARPGLRLTSSDPNHEETTMARNVLRIAVLLAALAPGLGRAGSDLLAAPDGGPPAGIRRVTMGGPFHGPMPFGDDPGLMLPMLLQGVGLSDDQKKQVRDLLKADHATLYALFEQLRAAN